MSQSPVSKRRKSSDVAIAIKEAIREDAKTEHQANSEQINEVNQEEGIQNLKNQLSQEVQRVSMLDIDEKCLTCEVCYEIIHSPVNCSPCNHKFCASCLYRWLDVYHTCPKCRYVLKEITRDVFANHVCEQYLLANPGRSRERSFLTEMDRSELDFLEKLLKRSRHSNRRHTISPIDEEDEEAAINLERENPGSGPRRLFLGKYRQYREREWIERSQRLREQLGLPKREETPPPPEGSRSRRSMFNNVRDMLRFIEFGEEPPYVRSLSSSENGTDDEIENNEPVLLEHRPPLGYHLNVRRLRSNLQMPFRAAHINGPRIIPGVQPRYGAMPIRPRRNNRPSQNQEVNTDPQNVNVGENNPPPSPQAGVDSRRAVSEPILPTNREEDEEETDEDENSEAPSSPPPTPHE